MDKAKAIKELLDDKNYYGDFGSKYLSNSDIIFLLKNPTQFKVPIEKSKPLIEGGYFHTCMLEPEKKIILKSLIVHQGLQKYTKKH